MKTPIENNKKREGRAIANHISKKSRSLKDGFNHPSIETRPENTQVIQREYKTAFNGVSLGTEQELSGVKMSRGGKATNQIGEVRSKNTGDLLLEITTDMGGDFGTEYKIEIKTTPTEMDDQPGWQDRKQAFHYLSGLINEAAQKKEKDDRHLITCENDDFKVNVFNTKHILTQDGMITGSTDQVTMGMKFEDLGTNENGDQYLQKYASWIHYDHGKTLNKASEPIRDPDNNEQDKSGNKLDENLYAFLVSAIEKLAEVLKYKLDHPELPDNSSEIKNQWGVLPRIPPIKCLEVLSVEKKGLIKEKIKSLQPTNPKLADTWESARKDILEGTDLGGHVLQQPNFGSSKGMLFEFRTNPPGEFGHALYRPHLGKSQQENKTQNFSLRDALNTRAASAASQNDNDDDWDDDTT